MASVQPLRDFIRQRLAAAAEEIFSEVERTVGRFEEELEAQRRLLEVCLKPRVRLRRMEHLQPRCKEEEVLTPYDSPCRPGLAEPEPPEPPHVKEEQMDLSPLHIQPEPPRATEPQPEPEALPVEEPEPLQNPDGPESPLEVLDDPERPQIIDDLGELEYLDFDEYLDDPESPQVIDDLDGPELAEPGPGLEEAELQNSSRKVEFWTRHDDEGLLLRKNFDTFVPRQRKSQSQEPVPGSDNASAGAEPKRRRKFDIKFKEKVLEYAAEHSAEQTAKRFDIDSKRIRYWRKQRLDLAAVSEKRARLPGGGRRKLSEELDAKLSDWIHSARDGRRRVSRAAIRSKALEIYATVRDRGPPFVASRGWLQKFLNRNGFASRRRAAAARSDPDLLTEKLVSFVDHVSKTVVSKRISQGDIIAMDETTVRLDVASPRTVDVGRAKGVAREKTRVTAVLAAAADGTKLKPFVVFRGAVQEVKETPAAVIATSPNGWMSDALTEAWLRTVLGKSSLRPRLLVWDAYRCHISASTRRELSSYDVAAAVVPAGCTKYVHAPDVMWNRPFRAGLQAAYDAWVAGDADKRYAAGGALKAPCRRLLVDWAVSAWDHLDREQLVQSFKACGLSVEPDGSEDHLILCFRDGQPSAAGRRALTAARLRGNENRRAAEHEEDEEELFNNELVVESGASDEEEETEDDDD